MENKGPWDQLEHQVKMVDRENKERKVIKVYQVKLDLLDNLD